MVDPKIVFSKNQHIECMFEYVVFIFTLYPVTLRPYQKNSYFRKFLEYVAPVKKTSLFCTQSYPEDALKINVKHVGFLNQMSEMNQNEENVST